MSVEKATNPCNKFQANIFNTSKCQNCFKSREVHLMNDDELEQAKPVYGGWLCLAPEGTDFDNPVQRSRKWQRRFFILYENGNLSFALDELLSTLPQGMVDTSACTSVADAEPRTGQRNALCISTPQQDLFIRGESREMINGWCEQIALIQRSNKHSCSIKHKVDHDPKQEPCPAKMAANGTCLMQAEGAGGLPAEPGAGLRKDAQLGGEQSWTATDRLGQRTPFSGNRLQCHAANSRGRSSSAGTEIKPAARCRGTASASPKRNRPSNDQSISHPAQRASDLEPRYPTATGTKLEGDRSESRMGRSDSRVHKREKIQSCGDVSHIGVSQRRAKSLDRRTSESIMTPDLLNFKKGWMVKLEREDQWRKFWFVLSADSLRYYKDSIAEEAFDLQGDIDLTKCYDVSEHRVLRNYGFQIHTQRGVYTLSAMTAGIRKNWIQALMKNVNPAHAPDAVSFQGLHVPAEALPKPDVTRASPSKGPTEEALLLKDPRKTLQERRRGGVLKTSKTSDLTESGPLSESSLELGIRRSEEPCSLETVDQERWRRRRQQRRRRYESILGFALSRETAGEDGEGRRDVDPPGGTSGSQQVLEEDMEKVWMQVERTAFRAERVGPLLTEAPAEERLELQRLMETYRQGVEDLRSCLEESECRRLELETQLKTAGCSHQTEPRPGSEGEAGSPGTRDPPPLSAHAQSIRDIYLETRGLLQQQNTIRQSMQEQLRISPSPSECDGPPRFQMPSIWLHDANGNQRELGGFGSQLASPPTPNTSTLSLTSDEEEPLPHYEGGWATPNTGTHLEMAPHVEVSSTDTHVNETTRRGKCTDEGHKQTPNLFESLCDQDEGVPSEPAVFNRLSQEAELLRGQNHALLQHNQEMLNQLTEADREIERLKVDVGLLRETEQRGKTRVVFLETELNSRNQGLLEAEALVASLEKRLSMVESQDLGCTARQVQDLPEEPDESRMEVDEATKTKLVDLERKLHQSEQSCSELHIRNEENEEAATMLSWRIEEAEAEVVRLSAELEKERLRGGQKIPDEERFVQVSEGKHKGELMEVMGRSEFRLVEMEQQGPKLLSFLQWAKDEFWGTMFNKVKVGSSKTAEEKLCVMMMELTKLNSIERQLLLQARDLLLDAASCSSIGRTSLLEIGDGTYSNGTGSLACATPEIGNWSDITGTMDFNNLDVHKAKRIRRDFTASLQRKMYLLSYIASVNTSSTSDELRLIGQRLSKVYHPGHRRLHTVHTPAADAWLGRLMGVELKEIQQQAQTVSSPTCANCARLRKENSRLRAQVNSLEKGTKTARVNAESQMPSIWLQDTEPQLQELGDSNPEDPSTQSVTAPGPVLDLRDPLLPDELQSIQSNEDADVMTGPPTQGEGDHAGAEEHVADSLAVSHVEQELAMVESIQTPGRSEVEDQSLHDSEDQNQEVRNIERSNRGGDMGLDEEREASDEEEEDEGRVVRLRGRVKELEKQLCLVAEELKAEHDGIMSALRLQHENDIERLKAACERGLASMEESQQRVLEGIQLHHQGELDRLMADRDQLLEEETAATVMAIESIKRAYQLQLDTQLEMTHQSRVDADSTLLQEAHQQHREELDVLAQQYSLQRLENGHLGQALDAERKALTQCQQENQTLRARNQELSGLLAADVGRLCSCSQREVSPLRRGADVYEQEISLRVKESEIQCLRQDVTSLKDELLLAHKDRSLAVKQQTESSTELTMLKVRFQRDLDILQENLRLAHRALEQTIP